MNSVLMTSFTALSPPAIDKKRLEPGSTGYTFPKATTAVACRCNSCEEELIVSQILNIFWKVFRVGQKSSSEVA